MLHKHNYPVKYFKRDQKIIKQLSVFLIHSFFTVNNNIIIYLYITRLFADFNKKNNKKKNQHRTILFAFTPNFLITCLSSFKDYNYNNKKYPVLIYFLSVVLDLFKWSFSSLVLFTCMYKFVYVRRGKINIYSFIYFLMFTSGNIIKRKKCILAFVNLYSLLVLTKSSVYVWVITL